MIYRNIEISIHQNIGGSIGHSGGDYDAGRIGMIPLFQASPMGHHTTLIHMGLTHLQQQRTIQIIPESAYGFARRCDRFSALVFLYNEEHAKTLNQIHSRIFGKLSSRYFQKKKNTLLGVVNLFLPVVGKSGAEKRSSAPLCATKALCFRRTNFERGRKAMLRARKKRRPRSYPQLPGQHPPRLRQESA